MHALTQPALIRLTHMSLLCLTPPLLSGGSWYQSCTPVSFDKSVLSAYCGLTYQNGTKKLSSINMAECYDAYEVTQQYGTLQCAGAALSLPGVTLGKFLRVHTLPRCQYSG